jgi:hypothetical protein
MNKTPDFRISVDTRTLADFLAKVPIGGFVSYANLSDAIGRNTQSEARPALQSARNLVQRDHGIVFDCIRGEGMKRLNDLEKVDTSDKVTAAIRRKSRKGIKVLATVENFDAMPTHARVKHNTSMSLFALVEHASKPSQLKKLAARVEKGTASLNLTKTLEAQLEALKNKE